MRTQDPPPLSGSPVLEKQGRLGTLNSPRQDLAEPPPCQDLEAPPPPLLAPVLPPLRHSGARSPAARRRIRPSSRRRTPLLPLPRACSRKHQKATNERFIYFLMVNNRFIGNTSHHNQDISHLTGGNRTHAGCSTICLHQ